MYCRARVETWKRLLQKDRAALEAAKPGGDTYKEAARLISCPTCKARAGRPCNPVRR